MTELVMVVGDILTFRLSLSTPTGRCFSRASTGFIHASANY